MQNHSIEYRERTEEFRRMLIISAQSASQLLIMSPNQIDSLNDFFKSIWGDKRARDLRKTKKLVVNSSLTVFLEAGRKDSGFSRGHVFLPWASMNTVNEAVADSRTIHTFYIPHSGPESGPGTVDELKKYLKNYPDSLER